jgi:hypothetical protein
MRAFVARNFGEAPAIHGLPIPASVDAFLIRDVYRSRMKLIHWRRSFEASSRNHLLVLSHGVGFTRNQME